MLGRPWFFFCFLGGALPPGVVYGVLPLQNELRNGHQRVPLPNEILNDPRQGLRRVLGRVVKQADGPRLNLACHPLRNIGGR